MMKHWKQILTAATGLVIASCGGGNSIGGLDAEAVFSIPLTQAAEVPVPKTTTASGNAQIVLFADKVDFEITGTSITGVTMAHIHNGAAGVAGPIVVTLLNQASSPSGVINGVIASGSLSSSNLPAGVTVASLKTLLLSGNAYVNVHTTTNPSGEIRGQVK
jgi:hypothetical protein